MSRLRLISLKPSCFKAQGVLSVFIITFVIITTWQLPAANASSLPSIPEELPKPEAWNSWKTSFEERDLDNDDDDYIGFIQKLIAGIITFVIVVVAVCLILCFCCPICIIAKMRKRRGAVIRTGNGTTTTVSNGQTVTVTMNRSAPPTTSHSHHVTSAPVVAIPNNYNASNKPYPVQESVTVVPLLQPQQHMPYPSHPQPMNVGYPPTSGPQYHPQNFELPPPYPGLPRDSDTSNLPYNPYYTGDNEGPNAPPPK